MIVNKKLRNCRLVGTDSNAFALMAHFRSCAKKEGWTEEEIKKVISAAMADDYDHLLETLTEHCENP